MSANVMNLDIIILRQYRQALKMISISLVQIVQREKQQ
jgi:hypothetical protein